MDHVDVVGQAEQSSEEEEETYSQSELGKLRFGLIRWLKNMSLLFLTFDFFTLCVIDFR